MLSPTSPAKTKPKQIFYPASDGLPMADNTKQFRWIVTLADNLQAMFHDRDDVFVSGNQLWYPVENEPEVCASPDVYVVFGRPKGDRSSYQQWKENNIPLTVAFEIVSPSNSYAEMINKLEFYDEHGVEEYYVYDPENNRLQASVRGTAIRLPVPQSHGFVSPRLGIRFDLSGPELVVLYPDGQPFQTFEELAAKRWQAEQWANQEKKRADQAEQRAERLAELSRKLLAQQATSEEIRELRRLSQPSP